MALEPLGGPYPLLREGVAVRRRLQYTPHWVDGLGLVGWWGSGADGETNPAYGVAQMDGVTWTRNNNTSGSYASGHIVSDIDGGGLLRARPPSYGGDLSAFRAITGSALDVLYAPASWPSQQLVAQLADRYLWIGDGVGDDGKLYSSPLGSTTLTLEHTFSGASGRGTVSAGPEAGQIWVAFESGHLWLYDAADQLEIGAGTGIGMSCLGVWYSQLYDLFVTLHEVDAVSQALRAWAREARPSAVSAPEALEPLVQGRVAALRTQVTGSYGEPCAGRRVDWSLTGDGALAAAQSETDADGYALVDYVAPVALGTEQANVTAEVVY